jgi:hypothetical protein
MAEEEGSPDAAKIYVDDSVPAVLRHSGKSVPYPTLREAVVGWYRLSDEIKKDASIKVEGAGGTLYRSWEIARLRRRASLG